MQNKFIILIFSLGTLGLMLVYFLVNPSYQKSIEAKYYYETGAYKEAYTLANEAFAIDVYNRMASTIMAQSKTSLRYVAYINDAKKYMKEIDDIAKHDILSNADKAKMRIMSQIMIDSYVKLAPSVITDNALVEESASYYKNFEKLLEKVNR
ncbi:MAG: hypothetical protein QM497_03660 [Sulfurimonas sp.]